MSQIIEKYITKGIPSEIIPEGFHRYIGNDGQVNHYGLLAVAKYNTRTNLRLEVIPLICGHGGSQWLCGSCYDNITKQSSFPEIK